MTIADLIPDPRNARKRGPRAEGMIVKSLQEVGAARSIVIDEDGRILAGNGTVQAAAEAGIENVTIVDASGLELVAVRRSGLTEAQKKRLAVLDNRTGELAEWDAGILAELSQEIDLTDLWNPQELEDLLRDVPGTELLTDPDEIPEEVETRAKVGDLWQLGDHRLLCGDSTKREDVERLLAGAKPFLCVTDPPYGVEYDPKWRNEAAKKGLIAFAPTREGEVANDDRIDWRDAYALFPGTIVYCWHAGQHASEVQESLEASGFEIRCQIVWAKQNFVISRGHYHGQHEPCWYMVRKGATAEWIGDRSQSTLWTVAWDKNVEGGHSTQKPVEIMQKPIKNHEGDVYDPFLGSGTTLIAAEQLGRRCFGCEIEPKYVDVCLARWEAATGKQATLIKPGRKPYYPTPRTVLADRTNRNTVKSNGKTTD